MESTFRGTCPPDLIIIETLRSFPGGGLVRWARHRGRMLRACARLGVAMEAAALDAAVAEVPQDATRRVRLTVDLTGRIDMACPVLGDSPPLWRVAISDVRLDPDDPWRGLKTSNRGLYDAARAALPDGVEEIVFLNHRGEVAEGTITNVFADCEGEMLTPPLASGVLPGILREELLETGQAREAVLRRDDLLRARRLWVGNSLRGLVPATLV